MVVRISKEDMQRLRREVAVLDWNYQRKYQIAQRKLRRRCPVLFLLDRLRPTPK